MAKKKMSYGKSCADYANSTEYTMDMVGAFKKNLPGGTFMPKMPAHKAGASTEPNNPQKNTAFKDY
ncbi:MAG: hypothetical protein GY937_19945 [bacterium]|nr:hypothetical protein [bacterium]